MFSEIHDRLDDGAAPTLRTLLKEIRRGAAMIRGGYLLKTCYEFAMRRMTWRVQYDLNDATFDEAMRLLADITPLGIELLWPVDWRPGDSTLVSMIRAQIGFDLPCKRAVTVHLMQSSGTPCPCRFLPAAVSSIAVQPVLLVPRLRRLRPVPAIAH